MTLRHLAVADQFLLGLEETVDHIFQRSLSIAML
jgi:hypothetical protein